MNVPVDATVDLLIAPRVGEAFTVSNTGLNGTFENGNTIFSVNLPNGFSNFIATATFTVTVAMNDALKPFANGEDIQYVKVEQLPTGEISRSLVAYSGNQYQWPFN